MTLKTLLICLFLRITYIACSGSAEKWSYNDKNTPEEWETAEKTYCSGAKQSPIDIIVKDTVYDSFLAPILIRHNPPVSRYPNYTLENDGHKISLTFTNSTWRLVFRGSSTEYTAIGIHWHWGKDDFHGAEHKIDGENHPLEGHIVFWNSNFFNDKHKAMVSPDGLAVVAIEYEWTTDETANPLMDQIIQYFNRSEIIQDRGDGNNTLEIPGFDINEFLPNNHAHYYRYGGSLTTPPCTENVLWTVLSKTVPVTRRQVQAFRGLQFPSVNNETEGTPMGNNIRPIKALNPPRSDRPFRVVSRSFPMEKEKVILAGSTKSPEIKSGLCVILAIIFVTIL